MTIEQVQPDRSVLPQRVVCSLVGAVFLAAAVLKSLHPEGFLSALTASFSLNSTEAVALGAALVTLEASVGLALLLSISRHFASIFAMTMLVAFSVYLVAFHSPDAPSCGCLGLDTSAAAGSSQTLGVVRNSAMFVGLALTHHRSVERPNPNQGESS